MLGRSPLNVHNLSHELHPSQLQTLGLVAAIQSLCRDMSHQRRFQVAFVQGVLLAAGRSERVALSLPGCTRGLHNSARPSRARDAQVRLTRDGDCLTLQIADAGVGFNPEDQYAGLGSSSCASGSPFSVAAW
jgi:signal transduction histidine kinase